MNTCNIISIFFFQRRRQEREDLWIAFGCEQIEELQDRKTEELQRLKQNQKLERKKIMEQQMEMKQQWKKTQQEEAQFERLWVRITGFHYICYHQAFLIWGGEA